MLFVSCNPCMTGHLTIDGGRSWFPLKGRSQLTFLETSGISTDFKLKFTDTTAVAINQKCGSSYLYDYVTTTLYLNSTMTDSISFTLSSSSWLSVIGVSNSNLEISVGNILGETKEGKAAKNLNHYQVGSQTYDQTILIPRLISYPDGIDSIFIANNYGIVGFKYFGKNYSLK